MNAVCGLKVLLKIHMEFFAKIWIIRDPRITMDMGMIP